MVASFASMKFNSWIGNVAVGEAIGIGVIGTLFHRLAVDGVHILQHDDANTLFVAALAGVAEATSLSFFQWRILSRNFKVTYSRFWFFTALPAALGWVLGYLPVILNDDPGGGEEPTGSMVYLLYLMVVFAGAAMGFLFGISQ